MFVAHVAAAAVACLYAGRACVLQAKSREDKGTMLRVSPISGVIAPYSSSQLSVTFKPFALDGPKPFKAQPLAPPQQVQPFDGLLQVRVDPEPTSSGAAGQ